jgi:hypothetical protein
LSGTYCQCPQGALLRPFRFFAFDSFSFCLETVGYLRRIFLQDFLLTMPDTRVMLFSMQEGGFVHRRRRGMDNTAVSLIYTDDKYEVWVDAGKDNITFTMTDRGVTILFTRDEWLEFQEVIGNIMLEEEPEEEETE